jgi:hypothetical protein
MQLHIVVWISFTITLIFLITFILSCSKPNLMGLDISFLQTLPLRPLWYLIAWSTKSSMVNSHLPYPFLAHQLHSTTGSLVEFKVLVYFLHMLFAPSLSYQHEVIHFFGILHFLICSNTSFSFLRIESHMDIKQLKYWN